MNWSSAASPPVSAAAATAGRSPPSIAARRTAGAGDVRGLRHRVGHHPDQRALAQLAAEQAAQERLLGLGGRGEQSVDEFGAPRLRSLAGDLADLAERGVDVAARSATARAAGGGSERSAAQPTPICRCGSSPDSQDTTTATSFGSPSAPARRSRSAMRAILASRAEVAPTSADAVATSIELHEPSLARAVRHLRAGR